MTELACKIDGCGYEGTPQGLRSHVHGKKGDEAHEEAAENRAHLDWYPAAYGLDEESTNEEGGDDPNPTPSEDTSQEGTKRGSDEEADDTPEPDPSEGGTESPDEEDEYADQWDGVTNPSDNPAEGGSSGGSDEEGGSDPGLDPSEGGSKGGSGGLGTTLVLGTGALALAVLLRGRGSDAPESPDASTDAVPDKNGASNSEPRASLVRFAHSLRCLCRLCPLRGCPFDSRPVQHSNRTSRLPSLVTGATRRLQARASLSPCRWLLRFAPEPATPSRALLAGGFAAGCQRDLRSLPTRALKRPLGGARRRER